MKTSKDYKQKRDRLYADFSALEESTLYLVEELRTSSIKLDTIQAENAYATLHSDLDLYLLPYRLLQGKLKALRNPYTARIAMSLTKSTIETPPTTK